MWCCIWATPVWVVEVEVSKEESVHSVLLVFV